MNTREAIRTFRLFSDVLSPAQLDELGSQCRSAFFRAGSVLMTQGDFGNSMFGIVSGTVSVSFVDPHSYQNDVASLGAGEVVGEMALLTGDRRTATAIAVTNVDALEITKPALEQIFARAPYLLDNFAASLAIRRAMLDQIAAEHDEPVRAQLRRQMRKVFAGILGPRAPA